MVLICDTYVRFHDIYLFLSLILTDVVNLACSVLLYYHKQQGFFLAINLLAYFDNFRSLNSGLKNSLFIIHPLLFFLIFIKIKSFSFFKSWLFWFTMVLGGFWATQEFNWGGWWNWDSIELPALLCYLVVTLIQHVLKKNHIHLFFLSFKKTYLFSLIFILPKILTFKSIHSFINNSMYFLALIIPKIKINFVLYCYYFIILVFQLNSLFFFKYIVVYILIYYIFYGFRTIIFNKLYHVILSYIYLFFLCYNTKKINIILSWSYYFYQTLFTIISKNVCFSDEYFFWKYETITSMKYFWLNLRKDIFLQKSIFI